MEYTEHYAQFFTATILEWKHLLQPDKYKDIITGSLQYLVNNKRVKVFAFVIMSNHMHIMWQVQAGNKREDVQRDFLKYTSQQIKSDLSIHHPQVLERFKVNAKDRTYQFWERNPLSIDLYTHAVFMQKLEYIHQNPFKAGLCKYPEEYKYSSARFYLTGIDAFGFLTHLNG
jgi:REP element-mobilizing transposase RayT